MFLIQCHFHAQFSLRYLRQLRYFSYCCQNNGVLRRDKPFVQSFSSSFAPPSHAIVFSVSYCCLFAQQSSLSSVSTLSLFSVPQLSVTQSAVVVERMTCFSFLALPSLPTIFFYIYFDERKLFLHWIKAQ